LLPHAYPFVLIDRIIEYAEQERIVCLKNVSFDEEFFAGHFRENPVMPGVLIIEAMAQTSGLLISNMGKQTGAYLTRVNDARFKKPVVPGDRMIITSVVAQKFPPLYVFEVGVRVDDIVAAEAEITLAVM
jgi:beta-hydroxyacyl-ACP dehydratase FabZ